MADRTDRERHLAQQLRAMVEPAVEAVGCDLEDLTSRVAGRRRLITVLVDRDGGVDLDTVAEVSRAVSEVLDRPDADALLEGAYVLEVSSPGVDRPLTHPRHWRRNLNRRVAVALVSGGELVGRITDSDETGAAVEVEGAVTRLAFADVRRAVVQVEFGRASAPDDGEDL